jgi:hypothetical protein
METEGQSLISSTTEVSVVEGELVATIRELASRGVGSKAIARTVGVARNTVAGGTVLRGDGAPLTIATGI